MTHDESEPSFLASLVLRATSTSMPETTVVARVGRPYQRDGSWWCRSEVDGLTGFPGADIAGDDSLQALTLGITFLERTMSAFVRQGGVLTFDDGSPMPLEGYFRP